MKYTIIKFTKTNILTLKSIQILINKNTFIKYINDVIINNFLFNIIMFFNLFIKICKRKNNLKCFFIIL